MLNYNLAVATQPTNKFDDILHFIDDNSEKWTNLTSKAESKKLGQVFTPLAMASQLAALVPSNDIDSGEHQNIVDAGAGTGILSTTFAARVQDKAVTPMSVFGFETDSRLFSDFNKAWELFQEQAISNVNAELHGDFTSHAEQILSSGEFNGLPKPSVIVTNPPFIKLDQKSELAKIMASHGIPVTNMYAVFASLAISWLQDDGHLLLVCPRSFANGDYFKKFREWVGSRMSVEHVVLYRSRSCFANVLQENVCIYLKKSSQSASVRITVADTPTSRPEYDIILPAKDTIKDDGWWMPRSAKDIELININRARKQSLESLGLTVSTGKMELHRLTDNVENILVPAIYAKDFDAQSNWIWNEKRKPRMVNLEQKKTLSLPQKGGFIVIKRISSNDGSNPKRLLCALLTRENVGSECVTIDNHVQYIHRDGSPLSGTEAKALLAFLATDEANAVIRAISGTTQINKSDMAKLKLP